MATIPGLWQAVPKASEILLTIIVIVKHAGKKYEIDLDPTSTGEVFKFQLYSLTGVEPERQKILVKGGQLKDDTDLSKRGAKPGQTQWMLQARIPDGPQNWGLSAAQNPAGPHPMPAPP